MKLFYHNHFFAFLIFGICALNLSAQQRRVCPSQITRVSVFKNQAQVEREGKIALQEGIHQIVFEKISPFLVPGSIETKVSDGVEIISVSTQNDFLTGSEKPASILVLEDSLTAIKEHLTEIKADKDALAWQKELLIANKSLGGANQGVKAEELEDVLTIFQRKFQEFKFEQIRINRLEKTLLEQQSIIEQQLNEFKEGNLALSNQIVIQVKTNRSEAETKFELHYLVNGVSWQPFYDIRVKDTKSPMQFVLKANIQQTTGENWNNVHLKLTTSDPFSGGVKPVLQPAYLYFNTPSTPQATSKSYGFAGAKAPAAMAESDGIPVQATQNFMNLEFEVQGVVNLPSDNKSHLVELNRFSIPAIFGIACVPKLNSDVFLTAKVQSNDLINQLNGEANIYLNGTFTGKTYLSQEAGDSLIITLGKERRVISKREKVKEMCSKSFFGSSRKDANTIEITITNSGGENMELLLEDQVPLSNRAEIVVKVNENGGAQYIPESGLLTWKLNLAPNQTMKIRFSYEISYPADKIISGY